MAFSLAFSTTDYDQGKSILIQDASTGSPFPAMATYTLTVESKYSGVTLALVTLSGGVLASGFSIEVKNTDLGFAATDTIPDSVYEMILTFNTSETYTSEEVVYYNAMYTRDSFIASKAAYIDDVYNKDQDYANWLDFLVTSIESNAVVGNSSAIYYVFDIFSRLNT
jgi:hypothetical protein